MRLAALSLFVVACSSPPTGDGSDASTDSATPDVAVDVSADAPDDASVIPDASPDQAGPLAPNPPAGTHLCGSGTFDQSQAVATCEQSSLAGGGLTAACSSITMTTGSWQAWCSATTVYMWAGFDGLTTSTATCPLYMLDPDYEYGSGGGNTGNAGGNGYAGSPGEEIGGPPIDVAIWVTLSSASIPGSGALYVGGTVDPACKGPYGPQLMLGAELTWN